MNIELVYALPEKQQIVTIVVPAGTLAREAASQAISSQLITLSQSDASLDFNTLPIGVYGQVVADNYQLREGDRLELYRPLLQDPKERRRQMADQKSAMRASPLGSQK